MPTNNEQLDPTVYATRRKIRNVILGAAAIGLTVSIANPTTTTQVVPDTPLAAGDSITSGTGQDDHIRAAAAQLHSAARQHHERTGSFRHHTPNTDRFDEVHHAANHDTFLYAATDGDDCFYGGLLPGQPPQVEPDPTGEACDPQLLADAQQQLDAEEERHLRLLRDQITTELHAAADRAEFFATRNYRDGMPNFDQLPDPGLDYDISQDGRTLTLYHTDSVDGCHKLRLHAELLDGTRQVAPEPCR